LIFCYRFFSAECTYTSTDGSFFYNVSLLTNENFDYTFTATSGSNEGTTYWLNILESVNRDCGKNDVRRGKGGGEE
jgi:hypothetical protein